MVTPLFVSFFTSDYKEPVRRLLKSLRRHNLDFDVQPFTDLGSWQKNSQFKSRFIWRMLVENFDRTREQGRPIVWIDADAEVVRYPGELMGLGDADIAVCEWKHPAVDKTEMLSGTVYFRNSVRSHKVVDAWIEECDANPSLWDQRCLRKAVQRFGPENLKIAYLPVAYCFIHDIHKRIFPDVDPCIIHWQHSRVVKPGKP